MDLAEFRKEYSDRGLHREELNPDPVAQFSAWFIQATELGVHEPNAMTLATVDDNGMPFQRTVLLKYYDQDGFVFFTNYGSRKAAQIAANPQVSLLFPWITLERQVIIQGHAEKISTAESLRYFASRPRESQIGAWVSNQSEVITSRKFLMQKLAEIRDKFQPRRDPAAVVLGRLPRGAGGHRVLAGRPRPPPRPLPLPENRRRLAHRAALAVRQDPPCVAMPEVRHCIHAHGLCLPDLGEGPALTEFDPTPALAADDR